MHSSAFRNVVNKTALALSLTLAITSMAHAQVFVTDASSIAANQAGFASQLAKTIDQYTTQLQQLQTELSAYSQMISSISSLTSGMSLVSNQMVEINDATPLIQAKCGDGAGAGIVGNLLNSVTSLVNQSISQSQKNICAQIVTTQVYKYNLTVAMINRVSTTYGGLFGKLESIMQSISTVADANRASDQAQHYAAAMTTEMSDYEAQIKAQDAMINSLQDMQSTLAQSSLRGNPSLVGDAVQAGLLTAAFTYHPSLDN